MSEKTDCSLYYQPHLLLITPEAHLCPFCYEICQKATPSILESRFDCLDRCTCSHEGITPLFLYLLPCFNNFFRNPPIFQRCPDRQFQRLQRKIPSRHHCPQLLPKP